MKKVVTIMYLGIAAFFLLGLFFCGFYAPNTFGLYAGNSNLWDYFELSFYWLCSIPCFILLCLMIKTTNNVCKEDFFSSSTVKCLKVSGYLLSIDSSAFLIINIVFAILRQSLTTEILMALLSLVGVAIGVSIILSSRAVEQSKQYKENGEGIL